MAGEGINSVSLFPVLAESSKNKAPTLFPAFGDEAGPSARSQRTSLDWLQNESFKKGDADLLHQISQKTVRSETSSREHSVGRESDTGSEEEEDIHPEQPRNPVKRKFADDIRKPIKEQEESDESDHTRHKKKKKKEHKKHKKHKKDKYEKRSSHKDAKPSKTEKDSSEKTSHVSQPTAGKVFIDEVRDLKPEHAYRIDRKSDQNNLIYEGLYKMHIARYHRLGNDCLGQGPNQVVIFGSSKKRKGGKGNEPQRYYEGTKMARATDEDEDYQDDNLADAELSDVRKSKFTDSSHQHQLYIPLQPDKDPVTKTQNPKVNPLGIYDSSTELYIQGKSPAFQTPERAAPTERDIRRQRYQESLKKKNAEFNKHLYDNPEDISKWLEFIDFQDIAVPVKTLQSNETSRNENDRQKKGNAVVSEIKLSILEKALEKNPNSVLLKTKQLEVGADIWEKDKLNKEWHQFVFIHPNDPDLWWHYLIFLQSNITTFTVSTVVKAYSKCLSTLGSILDGTLQSHKAKPQTEEHLLGLFQQLTHLLAQAGHMEKAAALYQASLELNLFCPSVLATAATKDKLEFLEAFWDSGVPRVGENGASGFGVWVNSKGDVPFNSMYSKDEDMEVEDSLLTSTTHRCSAWVAMETSRMSRHILPWRPDIRGGETEEDCEDLECLVMFDDISPSLISLTKESTKLDLVTGFLELLGLQCMSRSVCAEPVLQRSFRTSLDRLSQVTPLAAMDGICEAPPVQPVVYQVAVNVLEQVLSMDTFSRHSKTRLTLLLLEVKVMQLRAKQQEGASGKKWRSLCKEVKKYAKGLLKEEGNRSNLLLWDAFVTMDWVISQREDARRALHTMLAVTPLPAVHSTDDIYSKAAVYKLYRTSAELELGLTVPTVGAKVDSVEKGPLDTEHISRALCALACLADGQYESISQNPLSAVPATRLLRVGNSYQAGLDALLLQQEDITTKNHGNVLKLLPQVGAPLTHWTVCYALFQYLTKGIQAGVIIIQKVLQRIGSNITQISLPFDGRTGVDWTDSGVVYQQAVYEELTMACLHLLQRHLAVEVVSLKSVRVPLQQSLRQFPDSPQLLHMYIELEKSTNIVGCLRRYLLGVSPKSQTPFIWLYGAMAEMVRHQKITDTVSQMELVQSHLDIPDWIMVAPMASGSQHQLRAWFERAVSSSTSRHCVLLWRLFFQFELSEGARENAKAIFYRGVQQCPAAKLLYMDYARAFPAHLEEVTDLLTEKELRLRIPLEELDLLLQASTGDPDNTVAPPSSAECSSQVAPREETCNDVSDRSVALPSSVDNNTLNTDEMGSDAIPEYVDLRSIPLPQTPK